MITPNSNNHHKKISFCQGKENVRGQGQLVYLYASKKPNLCLYIWQQDIHKQKYHAIFLLY